MTKGAPEVVHDIVNLGNNVCGPRVLRRRKTGRLPDPTLRPPLLLQVAVRDVPLVRLQESILGLQWLWKTEDVCAVQHLVRQGKGRLIFVHRADEEDILTCKNSLRLTLATEDRKSTR